MKSEETQNLATNAKISRSPHMYPAFMLASNEGLRDTEPELPRAGSLFDTPAAAATSVSDEEHEILRESAEDEQFTGEDEGEEAA